MPSRKVLSEQHLSAVQLMIRQLKLGYDLLSATDFDDVTTIVRSVKDTALTLSSSPFLFPDEADHLFEAASILNGVVGVLAKRTKPLSDNDQAAIRIRIRQAAGLLRELTGQL